MDEKDKIEVDKKIDSTHVQICFQHDTVKKLRACAGGISLISVGDQLERMAQEQEGVLCNLYNQLIKLKETKTMKCSQCHRHYKPERNLTDTYTTCPDCSHVYDNTVQLEQIAKAKELFEEILVCHVAAAELRDFYRHTMYALLSQVEILG